MKILEIKNKGINIIIEEGKGNISSLFRFLNKGGYYEEITSKMSILWSNFKNY